MNERRVGRKASVKEPLKGNRALESQATAFHTIIYLRTFLLKATDIAFGTFHRQSVCCALALSDRHPFPKEPLPQCAPLILNLGSPFHFHIHIETANVYDCLERLSHALSSHCQPVYTLVPFMDQKTNSQLGSFAVFKPPPPLQLSWTM